MRRLVWLSIGALIGGMFLAPPQWLRAQGYTPPLSIELRDEGTVQGRAIALDCVGTSIDCTFSATVGTLTISGGGGIDGTLTATRVPFASDADTLTDDADLTFVTDTLTATKAVFPTSATVNADGTLAIGTNGGVISQQTAGTPDQSGLWTGTTSNAWIIAEAADKGFDFAHAASSTPALWIHSANQSTTQWMSLTHNGTNGIINAGAGNIQFGKNIQLDFSVIAGNGVGLTLGPSNNTSDGGTFFNSYQTPDLPQLSTGTVGNAWSITERADFAFDFNNGPCGTAACTDPTVVVHTAAQNTTQYHAIAGYGSAGYSAKTLTDSTATSVVRIPVASGAMTGGELRYTIVASDATDHQSREGSIRFAVVNKGGTETCSISGASEVLDLSVVAASTGTLTYAITCDTTPTNAVDIQFNAVSSLTETTLEARYRIDLIGPGQPARQ